MSTGPYLYDDGPSSPFTGTPRRRRGMLAALFIGTVAVALLAVVALPFFTGSATDRATEVTGVFLKALAKGDTETGYQLLCQSERVRLTPEQVAPAYLKAGPGTVGHASETTRNGDTIELVDVHWSDGSSSRYTLVNESGPRVCGTRPLG